MSFTSKMIVPKGAQALIMACCFLVMLAELFVYETVKNSSLEKECFCTFKEYKQNQNKALTLKFDCEGKEGYSSDADLIIAYLQNPQAFSSVKCFLYESGRITLKKE